MMDVDAQFIKNEDSQNISIHYFSGQKIIIRQLYRSIHLIKAYIIIGLNALCNAVKNIMRERDRHTDRQGVFNILVLTCPITPRAVVHPQTHQRRKPSWHWTPILPCRKLNFAETKENVTIQNSLVASIISTDLEASLHHYCFMYRVSKTFALCLHNYVKL